MGMTRRQMMAASLGLFVAGCSEGVQRVTRRPARRPEPLWPDAVDWKRPDAASPARSPGAKARSSDAHVKLPAVQHGSLRVLPRSNWTRTTTHTSSTNPMGGITHITVHHAGMGRVQFSDTASTIDYLELIRHSHVNRRWADIGYHLIVDRAGRTWQGRPLQYQGAHVRHHNEHNIGILTLGNFDLQSPTQAQLAGLEATVAGLMQAYHVTVDRVRTHQEWVPTACPGKTLQAACNAMRSRRLAHL